MLNKFLLRGLLVSVCLLCSLTGADAYTTTTNYTFKLPQVNNAIDQDQWGTELNSNFTSLDALLKTATNAVTVSMTTNTVIDSTYQNKVILADATGAGFTVTLQAAATAGSGFKVTVKKIDSTGNTVTVAGNAAELIDLTNTQSLTGQNASLTLVSNGTQWYIVPFTPQVAVAAASTSVSGILKLATNAMTKTGSDSATAVTPASLASLATASASGSIVLGAVTIEWGSGTGGVTVTFPTAFSNTPYSVVVTSTVTGGNCSTCSTTPVRALSITSTSFVPYAGTSLSWMAIGPT